MKGKILRILDCIFFFGHKPKNIDMDEVINRFIEEDRFDKDMKALKD